MEKTNETLTIWQESTDAQTAMSKVLALPADAIRANGSKASFPIFAEARGIVIDKTDANFDRDAAKALRKEFNSLVAEYHVKVKPIAAGLLAQDGFRVNSLQPKFTKTGEFNGCNIAVRREPKGASLALRAENSLLRKQLAEVMAKLAALPA
jgi:hypothetical protein